MLLTNERWRVFGRSSAQIWTALRPASEPVVALYLDDNVASRRMARQLRAAGHLIYLPEDVGAAGAEDAVHLEAAIALSAVLRCALRLWPLPRAGRWPGWTCPGGPGRARGPGAPGSGSACGTCGWPGAGRPRLRSPSSGPPGPG